MLLPLYAVAAVVNILAKANNYNIDIPNSPDFDLRVKRYIDNQAPELDISRDVRVNFVNQEKEKGVVKVDEDAEPLEVNYGNIKGNTILNYIDNDFKKNEIHNSKKDEDFNSNSLNTLERPEGEDKMQKRSYYLLVSSDDINRTGSIAQRNKTNNNNYLLLSESSIPGYNVENTSSVPNKYNNKNSSVESNKNNANVSLDDNQESNIFLDRHPNVETSTTNINKDRATSQNPIREEDYDYDNGGYFVLTPPKTVDIYRPTYIIPDPKINNSNKTIGKNQTEDNLNKTILHANRNNGTIDKKNETNIDVVDEISQYKGNNIRALINDGNKRAKRGLESDLDYDNDGYFIYDITPNPPFKKKIPGNKPITDNKNNTTNNNKSKDPKKHNKPTPTSNSNEENDQTTNIPKHAVNSTPKPHTTKKMKNKSSEEDKSVESNENFQPNKKSHQRRWHTIDRWKRSYYLPVPNNHRQPGSQRKPNQGYYPLSDTYIPGYNDGHDVYNFEGGNVHPYPTNSKGQGHTTPTAKDKHNKNPNKPKHAVNSTPRPVSTTKKTTTQKTRTKNNKNKSSEEDSSVKSAQHSQSNNKSHQRRWHAIDRLKRSYYLPVESNGPPGTNKKPTQYYPLSDTYIPGYNDGHDVYDFEGGNVQPYPTNEGGPGHPQPTQGNKFNDNIPNNNRPSNNRPYNNRPNNNGPYNNRPNNNRPNNNRPNSNRPNNNGPYNNRPNNNGGNYNFEQDYTHQTRPQNENPGFFRSAWNTLKDIFSRKKRDVVGTQSDKHAGIKKRNSFTDFFNNIVEKVQTYTAGKTVVIINKNNTLNDSQNIVKKDTIYVPVNGERSEVKDYECDGCTNYNGNLNTNNHDNVPYNTHMSYQMPYPYTTYYPYNELGNNDINNGFNSDNTNILYVDNESQVNHGNENNGNLNQTTDSPATDATELDATTEDTIKVTCFMCNYVSCPKFHIRRGFACIPIRH